MKSISIIIADDQKLFASTIELLLREYSESTIQVLGVAHNGHELLDKVGQFRPDLALVDVRMPGMDGIEATRLIRNEYPEVKVLILTTYDDDEYVDAAMKYGASGYVLTRNPGEIILCHDWYRYSKSLKDIFLLSGQL